MLQDSMATGEGRDVNQLDALLSRLIEALSAGEPEPAALSALLEHLSAITTKISAFALALDRLTALRQFAAAEHVANLFLRRFPDSPLPLSKAMRLARLRRDWNTAAAHARALRLGFPERATVSLEVNALRMAGRRDEARALADQMLDESAPERGLLLDACWLAMMATDWAATLRLAGVCRQFFPNEPAGISMAVTAMTALGRFNEAAELLREAEPRFPGAKWHLVDRAKLATARADIGGAANLWAEVRQNAPDDTVGYISGAKALVRLGRPAEAAAVIEAARQRFSNNRDVAIEYARLANTERDWAAAEARWQAARREHPGDFDIALQCALVPAGPGKRGVPEALKRLAALHEAFPGQAAIAVHQLRLQRDMGCDTVAAAGAAAMRQFPHSVAVALEYARVLSWAQKPEEGARVLADFLAANPGDPAGNTMVRAELADLLSQAGRHDEAERAIQEALQAKPMQSLSCLIHARIAERRGDLAVAAARWDAAVLHFPANMEVRAAASAAEQRRMAELEPVGISATPPAEPAGTPAALVSDNGNKLAPIFSRFESLGGMGQGCEFGMVQRMAGVEPLGLLRWARMRPENMIAVLQARFAGVGAPEQTELAFYDQQSQHDPEYTVRDRKFGMDMHTFTRRSEIPSDRMHKYSCRRLVFLKSKLLEDFAAGEKIFVYKVFNENLTFDTMRQIHGLLQQFGRVVLLYVRYADAEHPPGHVEWWAKDLLIGYITRFSMSMTGEPLPPLLDEWVSICTGALRLRDAAEATDLDGEFAG